MVSGSDNTLIRPSIGSIPESDLVRALINDSHWRWRLLSLHGLPEHPLILEMVPLNGTPGNAKGDVDILLCPPDRPQETTAIEVKRIKVGSEAFWSQSPNKLHEFNKGVQQTNRLVELGFFQVYLFVLVVVDSREHNAGKRSFAGLTTDLRYVIEKTVRPSQLSARAGLVRYEFVQPMDHAPLGTGTFETNPVRLAQPAVQPTELTKWVAQLLPDAA